VNIPFTDKTAPPNHPKILLNGIFESTLPINPAFPINVVLNFVTAIPQFNRLIRPEPGQDAIAAIVSAALQTTMKPEKLVLLELKTSLNFTSRIII